MQNPLGKTHLDKFELLNNINALKNVDSNVGVFF